MNRGLHSIDNRFSPWQFAFFRMVFGVYLTWHFALLLPDAAELFSVEGVLPDPSLNFTHPLAWWNPLSCWNSPALAQAWVAGCLVLAVLLTLGWKREVTALLLWLGWMCLFNRNNLISNPSIPYVGLLLLLTVLVPAGEPLRADGRANSASWKMPLWVPVTAWILMAVGYSFSGIDKLGSPSWVDGSALHHLLENPLARPGPVREILLALPGWMLVVMTWFVLAVEIMFAPLCLFRRGRAVAWALMLSLHLGIMLAVSFADLSLGMVMLHLFTFDSRWLPARKASPRPVVLFDGACGLCNHTARFLAEEDRDDVVGLAPLQSPAGSRLLRQCGISPEQRDTLVLVEWEHAWQRSEAVLRIARHLGGIWRLGWVLHWIPRQWRDPVYNWVARNRYRWFGDATACGLPSPQLRRKLDEFAGSEQNQAIIEAP